MSCKECSLNHFRFFTGSCTCYCHTGRVPKNEIVEKWRKMNEAEFDEEFNVEEITKIDRRALGYWSVSKDGKRVWEKDDKSFNQDREK